jgi:hypothetical protein
VGHFIHITIRFCRGRAHQELDRAVDHGEGLPLAVHDPSAVSTFLLLHQFGVGVLEFLLLFPLA